MFIHLPPEMAAKGAALRGVNCERCGCQYLYRMQREVRARVRQDAAVESLRNDLKKGFDVVPCPECGYLQADMVLKQKLFRGAFLAMAAVAGMTLMVLLIMGNSPVNGDGLLTLNIGLAWAALCAVFIFVFAFRDANTPSRMRRRAAKKTKRAIPRGDFPGTLPDQIFDN